METKVFMLPIKSCMPPALQVYVMGPRGVQSSFCPHKSSNRANAIWRAEGFATLDASTNLNTRIPSKNHCSSVYDGGELGRRL